MFARMISFASPANFHSEQNKLPLDILTERKINTYLYSKRCVAPSPHNVYKREKHLE